MFLRRRKNILEYDFWGLFFLSKVTPKSGYTHKICVWPKIALGIALEIKQGIFIFLGYPKKLIKNPRGISYGWF